MNTHRRVFVVFAVALFCFAACMNELDQLNELNVQYMNEKISTVTVAGTVRIVAHFSTRICTLRRIE